MDEQLINREKTVTNDLSDVNRRELARNIEEQYDNLLTGVRILIWKMGMSGNEKEANDLSYEILHETVITAFEIVERFDPEKSSYAWLMAIATNKIKELRAKEFRRSKRMGVVTETYQSAKQNSGSSKNNPEISEQITEDEMVDFLMAQNPETNPMHHKIHLTFEELASLVGNDDRLVLKLAFVDNLKGKDLAATLKTSVGAANVRLSRAISRLRQAYLSSEDRERS